MAKKRATRGRGSVYNRGGVWWIKYYRDKQPIRESSGSKTKQAAIEMLDRKRAEVGGSGMSAVAHKITMGEIFQLVVDDYVDEAQRDLYIVKLRIKTHLNPVLGKVRAAEFGSAHLKKYKDKRKSQGAAAATINRELAIIRRGLNIAIEMEPPLVTKAIKIKPLGEKNTREGFLDHSDYQKLRDCLDRARIAFVIGYHVGNRKGEILKLEWSMVDFRANELHLPQRLTKNKKPRTLPLYGDLRHFLEMAKVERDLKHPHCKWVCAEDGKQIKCFKGEWAAATKSAGVPDLLFHDLRRTGVRNMVRAGISETVAMRISGHLTRSVFDRYDIGSKKDVSDAGKKMELYLSSRLEAGVKAQYGHNSEPTDTAKDIALPAAKEVVN